MDKNLEIDENLVEETAKIDHVDDLDIKMDLEEYSLIQAENEKLSTKNTGFIFFKTPAINDH